jgi:SAM-dependent methyltransferase
MSGSAFAASDGAGYELQMGRWSRRLAGPFVEFVGLEPGSGEQILDMGCGTGSLTGELARRDASARVVGLDYSAAYVHYAAERATGGSSFLVADGTDLPFSASVFDRTVSQLVLHFVPDPDRAIDELQRVTRPGGVAAATVWDAGGGVVTNRLFCDTAAAISPGGEEFRARIFGRPMTQPDRLEAAWRRAGFTDIETATLTIRMDFVNFADYWAPYIGRDGPYAAFVSRLDQDSRSELTDAVQQAYLAGMGDGLRSYTANAWAVKGKAPKPESSHARVPAHSRHS